jgi:predicted acetyltransferase
MIIRNLSTDDIPAIIHLGARMHEESVYSPLILAPEKQAARCYQILDTPSMLGVVAVQDGAIIGMMGGHIYRYEYGDDLVASDILVYVSSRHRGSMAFIKMVRKYVKWAREQGAKLIFLNQISGIDPAKTSNIYSRLGFRPVGNNHCIGGS